MFYLLVCLLLMCLLLMFVLWLGVGYKSIYWHSVSFLLLGVGYKSIYWHSVSSLWLELDVSPFIGILFPFTCGSLMRLV
jgi:hypothetical protein